MQNYLIGLLLIILTPIIIEDFRHRKISVLWIAGIIVTAVFQQLYSNVTFSSFLINSLFNLLIILVNYVVLTLYFSWRNKKFIDIRTQYLGIGDVAFLFSVAFLLSPVNFICFLLSSLIFSLVFALVGKLLLPTKFSTIPLAGLQALFLAFTILVVSFQDKNWLINNDEFTLSIILSYAGIS